MKILICQGQKWFFQRISGKKMSFVDFLSVPDFNNANDKFVVLNVAENPVVADTITPQSAQITYKPLAPASRIVKPRHFVHIIENAFLDWFVQFACDFQKFG